MVIKLNLCLTKLDPGGAQCIIAPRPERAASLLSRQHSVPIFSWILVLAASAEIGIDRGAYIFYDYLLS